MQLQAPPKNNFPASDTLFAAASGSSTSSSAGRIAVKPREIQQCSYSASSASVPLPPVLGAAVEGSVLSEVIGEELERLRQVRQCSNELLILRLCESET
jgi:hypothetical protein